MGGRSDCLGTWRYPQSPPAHVDPAQHSALVEQLPRGGVHVLVAQAPATQLNPEQQSASAAQRRCASSQLGGAQTPKKPWRRSPGRPHVQSRPEQQSNPVRHDPRSAAHDGGVQTPPLQARPAQHPAAVVQLAR